MRNPQHVSMPRRHPATVTATRLGQAAETYAEKFTPEERDMIGILVAALDDIAEGRRSGAEGSPG